MRRKMIPPTRAVRMPPLLDRSVYVDCTYHNIPPDPANRRPNLISYTFGLTDKPEQTTIRTHLRKRIESLDRSDPIQLGEQVLGGRVRVVVERLVIPSCRVVHPEVWFEHAGQYPALESMCI